MEQKPDWTKAPDWATHWGTLGPLVTDYWFNSNQYAACSQPHINHLMGIPGHWDINSFKNVRQRPRSATPGSPTVKDWATMHGYYRGRSYWVGNNHYEKTDGSEATQYLPPAQPPLKWDNVTHRPAGDEPKQATPVPVDPVPPSMVIKYQIAGGEWSYSELRNNGWMDEQLVHQPQVWRENKPGDPILVPKQPKKSDFTEKEWSLMTDNNQPINLSTAPIVIDWTNAPDWADCWCAGTYLHRCRLSGKYYAGVGYDSTNLFDVGKSAVEFRPQVMIDPTSYRFHQPNINFEMKEAHWELVNNEPKRIYYIAGPMSGIENFNRDEFNKKAGELRAEGHVVLNPATLPDGLSEAQYMDIGIAMLRCATNVVMLRGWDDSRGAYAERAIALKLGIVVEYD
jgi:hypothetical protein